MIYGSVCSGIEAATVAWEMLGLRASFFSEIEKFPRQVLSHHYPDVPVHGDFTTIGESDYEPIDLLVGGTPCQAFSVAGLRKGLSDERGNLTLEFVRLAKRLRPKWLVWENVPGVLSIDGGRAFGSFLRGLGECWYGFSYRVLDAQYFGVPQRRRRVFVVGCLGDWRSSAQVLFEPSCLLGDITPSREEGKGYSRSSEKGSGIDVNTAKCLTCRSAGGESLDPETSNFILPIHDKATRHNGGGRSGNDGSANGLGIGGEGDPSFTLQASHGHAVCFGGDVTRTLSARYDSSPCADRGMDVVSQNMQVRRLTPRECERLQGFPDDYTKISEKTSDSSRYKALGNSMAVPVMRWIVERINAVETSTKKEKQK